MATEITTASLIATPATATIGQVQTYLKKKGADIKLKSLVPFYFFYGKLIGINPVFSILETGIESNWLTYKNCLLDASMKNTAGIKKSDTDITKYFEEHPEQKSTGSDHIKDCHMTFNRWTESVTAQIDHAALYSGLEGYPSAHTYDPRHFTWCYGLGKTINDFCVHYSTAEYSKTMVACLNEVAATKDEGVTFVTDKDISTDVASMVQEICTFYGVSVPGSGSSTAGDGSLYFVRKAYADTASQKGAFKVFDNAKNCAKANKVNVFDAEGNCVYSSSNDYEALYKAFYPSYLTLLNYRETLRKASNEAISALNTAIEATEKI